ncbi:MAG: VTT domain-containing protein [Pseudomonadota bacterium]
MSKTMAPEHPKSATMRRYLPIAALGLAAVLAVVYLGDYLSFSALEQNYQHLAALRDANWALTALVFSLVYIVAVAVSIPGATWLTLMAGFLFGTVAGGALVVVSATIGATLLFLAAKTSFGALLHEKAGAWIDRMEAQFREGEISFLLIMRLVPIFPFFVCNLVPAFLGVRLFSFVWTTLVGIIPGTLVFVSIGAGLGEQLARGEAPDMGVIFEPHVIGPLLGLALLAALPVILKKLGVTRGQTVERGDE